VDLLLTGTLALSLALLGGHEVLLLLAAESFTFGELGAAALVGLADVLGGERELLLSLLGEVGGVRHALVLGLGLGGLGLSILLEGLLLLRLGNGLTGLLVSQLGVAVIATPAVSGLLLVVTGKCVRGVGNG
jgi:hypothetical protein